MKKNKTITIGISGRGMSENLERLRRIVNKRMSKDYEDFFGPIFRAKRRHRQLVFDKETGELRKRKVYIWD